MWNTQGYKSHCDECMRRTEFPELVEIGHGPLSLRRDQC